ncbi:MFS transporter [Actinomadura sp. LD22]|uniref:MFS transporter n=1 Tax=Actinomadura physcomitrii TaxID=2650748 RepID=A0A6I4MFD6_9ACTN|nr:MFS transporter [Actinomadura physcomitrii]MWA03590.1 MFS transporter [Actinomadura physcomitrii]
MFLLTAVYGTDSFSPMQRALYLPGHALLMKAVVPYLIAAAVALPAGVLLGARHPAAVTIPAVSVSAIGGLLVAFTESAGVLSAGRVLGGLGTGASLGVTVALLLRFDRRRGPASAAMALLGALALIAAPPVNQAVSEAISFRWTFLLAEPLLAVALAAGIISGIVLITRRRTARPNPYGIAFPPPYQPPYPSPYPPPPPPPYQQPYPPSGPPQ